MHQNKRYRAFVKWLDLWNIFVATAMLLAVLYLMSLVSCTTQERIVSSSHAEQHDTVIHDTVHVQYAVTSFDTVHVTTHAAVHTVIDYDTVGRPMRLTRDEDYTMMADRLSSLQMWLDSIMSEWRHITDIIESDTVSRQKEFSLDMSVVTDSLDLIRRMIGYVLAAIFVIFLIYCLRCLGQYLDRE